MTAIKIRCPRCASTGRVPSAMVGRPARCKQCKTKFIIADPSVPDTAIPPALQTTVETPIPTPATSEPPATHQEPLDLRINLADDDPGWKSPPVAPATLQQLQGRLNNAVPYIPIAARVSLVLGIIYGLDFLKHFLNPFEALPSPNKMIMSLFTGGPQGVIYNLFSPLLIVKLLLIFWLSRQIRSWWQNRAVATGGVYGSAAWATEPELKRADMLGNHGLLLGRVPSPHLSVLAGLKRLVTSPLAESDAVIRYFVTAVSRGTIPAFTSTHNMICIPKGAYVHLLTVAPPGAGKGVGLLITNLLNHIGSVIVMDPMGLNFKATAEHRRTKLWSNVLCLDPFGITGSPSATFNPFELLDPLSATLVDDVKAFAEALVVKTDRDHDPHWNENAESLLDAVILLVACHATDEERNLNMVRKILSNKTELRKAINVMLSSDAAGGMLAEAGGKLDAIEEREFSSILSTTNRHLKWLMSPLVAANVASSSFDMTHILQSNTSLYLVLPPQYLRSHAGVIRLWLNCIFHVVKSRGATEKDELLFLLDEVAQLGQCEQLLEPAVTTLRGYGLRMWFFLQSLDQLKVCFHDAHANVMLSNFGVQQFFGVNELETAKYISARVGKTTATAIQHQKGETRSWGRNWSTTWGNSSSGANSSKGVNTGQSAGPIERDLIRPEEIINARDSVFIFAQRINPVLSTRLTYYSDPEFEPAISGTGLVTAVVKEQAATPKVSRCSYAVALCGVLLVASTVYSTISASIQRQQMAVARQQRIAKQAEVRKAEMERRKLDGEEPTPIKKQQTRRPRFFGNQPRQ